MIEPDALHRLLAKNGMDFFAGVPDSLMKHFLAYVNDHPGKGRHIIAANEGNAIALAAGYHLATGRTGVVYMQNSGLGNSANPLISLADKDVYGIPMLLIIGWRGRPGVKDEPQHVTQGRITRGLLKTLGIPFAILPRTPDKARAAVTRAAAAIRKRGAPYALLVEKDTFMAYKPIRAGSRRLPLKREKAIGLVLDRLGPGDVIVSSTGMISRELFETRERRGQPHDLDFLTVGSMGHSSQIALGVALSRPDREVYCFDGDGALIMHMGALALIAAQSPSNLKHVVFNNGAHDSVGGQPTCGFTLDIPAVAAACGYRKSLRAASAADAKKKIEALKRSTGPALLEIRVKVGARDDLGRPTRTPRQAKNALMRSLSER